MTVAIRTLWDKVLKLKKQGRASEDEDYEKDAAIEDVVEEEPVDFADPEDDEFELEDRCVIFSHVLYFTTLILVKLHLYLTHNS